MDFNSFEPKEGGFKVFVDEKTKERLKKREEILRQLKKEKGIDSPKNLPMPQFISFRKELFKRYSQAGV